jgi:hypothetical protein
VAENFNGDCVAVGRIGRYWRTRTRVYRRGDLTGDDRDGHRESRRRSGKVEPRGTRPRGGGSPVSQSAPATKQGSYDGESPELSPAVELQPGRLI